MLSGSLYLCLSICLYLSISVCLPVSVCVSVSLSLLSVNLTSRLSFNKLPLLPPQPSGTLVLSLIALVLGARRPALASSSPFVQHMSKLRAKPETIQKAAGPRVTAALGAKGRGLILQQERSKKGTDSHSCHCRSERPLEWKSQSTLRARGHRHLGNVAPVCWHFWSCSKTGSGEAVRLGFRGRRAPAPKKGEEVGAPGKRMRALMDSRTQSTCKYMQRKPLRGLRFSCLFTSLRWKK